MPKAFSIKGNERPEFQFNRLPIAVATHRTANADRMEFRYFLVDNSLKVEMNNAVFRRGKCLLKLLDSDTTAIAVDHFALYSRKRSITFDYRDYYACNLATLGAACETGQLHMTGPKEGESEHGYDEIRNKKHSLLFIVAPVFFHLEEFEGTMEQVPKLTFTRSITLSLDELKSVQSLKCEIAFDE